MSNQRLAYWGRVALWTGLYVVAAEVSRHGPRVLSTANFVWLPPGVGLAALLLYGYRYWPIIVLGTIISRLYPTVTPLPLMAGLTVAHVTEALVGTYLLRKVMGLRPELAQVRDVLALLFFGALLSPVSGAVLVAATLEFVPFRPEFNFTSVFPVVWLGDGMGVLIVTPMILVCVREPLKRMWSRAMMETAGLVGLWMAGGVLVAVNSDMQFDQAHLLEFSVFPLVIWTALRFGLFGAVSANFMVSLIIILGSSRLMASSSAPPTVIDMLWLPGLLLVMTITSLVVGVVTHERHEAGQEVHRSEQKFLQVFLSSPYSVSINRLEDGCYLDVNEAFERMTGYPRDEVVGHTVNKLNIWASPTSRSRFISLLQQNRQVRDLETEFRMKQGEIRHGLLSAETIEIDGEQCVLAVFFDITERKVAVEALRESEERFRLIFDHAPVGMVVQDIQGGLARVNPAFCEMMGYTEDELGQISPTVLTHPEDREANMARLEKIRRGEVDSYTNEKRYLRKNGSVLRASTSVFLVRDRAGNPLYTVAEVQDLTTRHALEDQIRQTQKMEAVGQLAGGVAHDFNNLMMVIRGYNELTLNRLEADDPLRKNAEEIQVAVDRASSLTQQLLAYGRRLMLQPVVFDLNQHIANVVVVLEQVVSRGVRIATELDPALPAVKADPEQIQRVLINLALNAGEAMPAGGVLTLKTASRIFDVEAAQRQPGMKPGRYCELTVQDTGVGMDQETLEHIFEPFFTTRDRTESAGLGLASVHGIVQQSGGQIWVGSEPGQGTTFKIYLPWGEDS